MSKDNGGPAFPGTAENYKYEGEPGMTLRDYFAATSGITFEDAVHVLHSQGAENPTGAEIMQMMACLRGGVADAMLLERDK